jgi:lathosterol oxidase
VVVCIVSLALMLLLHDAWFYWTHRLMHHPKIFRHVHLVHHRSINPSPWAAYSFHPIEAVIEAGIYLLIVFTIRRTGWRFSYSSFT